MNSKTALAPHRRQISHLLLVAALIAVLCPMVWADPESPTSLERQTAIAVATRVQKDHLTRHPLDKEISERCLETFLKSLDPMKVYFYQSDIDELNKQKVVLCDSIR